MRTRFPMILFMMSCVQWVWVEPDIREGPTGAQPAGAVWRSRGGVGYRGPAILTFSEPE